MINKRKKEDCMKKTEKLYGIVEGYENISFVLDGFQCIFFNTNLETKDSTIIPNNQGFILGHTIEKKYIYIYSGQDLRITNELILNTWIYFISRDPTLETYRAICFKGGILRKLFFQSSIIFEHTDTNETKVKYQNDSLTYPLQNEKIKGQISIYSTPNESMSIEGGNSISLKSTNLEIVFEEAKEIQSFSEILGYIQNMCQFMTFRHNVSFEEVILKDNNRHTIAECYIHYDHDYDTDKKLLSCITFNALGKCVTNLLDTIIDNKPEKPQFNIGFIPENDKKAAYISSMTIREVCSALESEMELTKIQIKQEKAFDELVKKLKNIVKEDRDKVHSLSNPKSYDYIFGTLRHMSDALAEKIEKCHKKYQSLIDEDLSKEQIDKLVKYRNTITHGNFMPLNSELAETTFILIKLVYCSILKRIGVEDNIVKDLFKKHIIP